MNKNNLSQTFQHYIDRFDYINEEPQSEYYKWQACHEFPVLMKCALSAEDEIFSRALYEAKKSTFNIIDSYTQPFGGLVEFSRNDPVSVRKLLKDLYSDDGGDLKIQSEIIVDFFKHSNDLLDKYSPGSFLFKQNSHSVSALLFLNDPDHHYMYKATQSQRFADCVEFFDDWGVGDNIKLDTYYRMCNELVEEIKGCDELLATDASRFDGRLKLSGGELHPDTKKHILAFDIIYCCSVYDLFDGISYTKRNLKEKQLYLAEKGKAEALKKAYDEAKTKADELDEALRCFVDMLPIGAEVEHNVYGVGKITHIDERRIEVSFPEKDVKFGLAIAIANGILFVENADFEIKVKEYSDLLRKQDSISKALEYASRALEPYEEYLD